MVDLSIPEEQGHIARSPKKIAGECHENKGYSLLHSEKFFKKAHSLKIEKKDFLTAVSTDFAGVVGGFFPGLAVGGVGRMGAGVRPAVPALESVLRFLGMPLSLRCFRGARTGEPALCCASGLEAPSSLADTGDTLFPLDSETASFPLPDTFNTIIYTPTQYCLFKLTPTNY